MTKKMKKTFIHVLIAVLICAIAVGLILPFAMGYIGVARAQEVQVTVYTTGNGSVSSGGQISATEPDSSIEVTVNEDGLTVKAEPAEGYIFRNWSTDAAGSKAISMKSEDSFTYEEVQAISDAKLYANFTTYLTDVGEREAAQITIDYDERLGDIYLFTDNKDVTEQQLQLHGLKINSNEPFEIPYKAGARSFRASDVVMGAIAKEEVRSTMDSLKMTSVVFENWSATYIIKNKEVVTNQLPEVCDISSSTGSQWPDGEKQWTPTGSHHPHGNIWWAGYWERGTQYTYVNAGKTNNDYWWTDPYYHASDYETTIGIDNKTIHANFAEVAAVPTMNITPTVDGEQQDQAEMEGNEAFISMPYGKENSVNVLIPKFDGEGLTDQNYNVSLKKGVKLDNQEEIVEPVQVSPVGDEILGFSILHIETNCTVVITPEYTSETNYVIEQLTIYINLVSDNGLQDIVSAESEEVKASDLNVEDEINWKLDPQYNSDALAFSSGLTYPENITQNEASQMHFQVKGSGVFTFEMYLDGMNYYSAYGHAVLGLGNPVDKSKVKGATADFTDGTTLLATGDSTLDIVAGAVYAQCKIKATDNVSRMSGSNWCNVSFNISDKSADETTDIYIAHIVTSYNTTTKGNLDMYRPHTVMIVRNVAFYQGMSDVKWDIYDNESGDKTNYGTISAKTNGADADPGQMESGTKIDFNIAYDDANYKFYGWSNGNELLSMQTDFTYTVKGSSSGESKTDIYAVLSPNENRYVYRVGGKFYDINNLKQAISDAESSSNGAGNIYILESLTLSDKTVSGNSLTIPKNVNFIIPFDETYRIHGSDAEGDPTIDDIAWRLPQNETQYKHIVVTIENITVNVNGGLYLGGVVNNQSHNYQGHTSGAYSQIENNGTIIVCEGGVFDVYGRVTGTGTVEVKDKGSLYQPFLILDYSGGTDALGLFMSGLTPFRRYAMINIECPITVNYGGVLYGHASLFALSSYFSLDQPFISYDMGSNLGGDGKGHDTFITLEKEAKVEITYDSEAVVNNATTKNGTAGIGKTKLVFTGGAKFSYMLFTAAGVSVPTNSVYFSIPYNFEVELTGEGAQYEVKTDFKLMPGSKITIGEGATLTCNANLNILDGIVQGALHDKSYPKAEDLKAANYSQSGNLIVNGKLIIGKKTPVPPFDIFSGPSPDFDYSPKPATLLGIIQTNGTKGSIQLEAGTIVEGKIFDGSTTNYFEYTTSARVWDAAHGRFAQLEAGKTYTATGAASFNPGKLLYATTQNGNQTNELDLSTQTLQGNWMEEHGGVHNFDWNKNEADDISRLDEERHIVLDRQCTVTGCTEHDHRLLLGSATEFEDTFKGEAFSEEDLLNLLKKLYKIDDGALTENEIDLVAQFKYMSGDIGSKLSDANSYTLDVTVTGAMWLAGDTYTHEKQLTFNLKPYALTGITADITVDEALGGKLPEMQYTGSRLTYDELTINFQGNKLSKSTDYTLDFGDNVNVRDGGTVTIKGAGNFAGEFTLEFDIKPVEISAKTGYTLAAQNVNFVYNGEAQTPTRAQLLITHANGGGFDNNAIKESDVIISAEDNVNAGRHTVTVKGAEDGNFVIDLSAEFDIGKKVVEIELKPQTVTYTGEKQEPSSAADFYSFADDAICSQGEAEDDLHIKIKITNGVEAINANAYSLDYEYQNDNYTVNRKADNDVKFTIDRKDISEATVAIVGKTYSYKGEDITPEVQDVEVTLDGWDKDITFTVTATNNRDKGTAHFTVTGTGNYQGTSKQGDFEIEAAKVEIQVKSLSSALGDELNTDYGYSFLNDTKFFGADKATFDEKIENKYSTDADMNQISDEQHQYKIELDVSEAQKVLTNYIITVEDGVYTVNDSVFSGVSFEDNMDVTYDGETHKLEIKLAPDYNLPDGAEISYKHNEVEFTGAKNVGTYEITVEIKATGHHTFTDKATLEIVKKEIVITADAKTKTFGDEDEALTWSIDENQLANADKELGAEAYRKLFTVKLERENGEDVKVGGYAITGSATADNYSVTVTGSTYAIEQKDITGATVTVDKEFIYTGSAIAPSTGDIAITLKDEAWDKPITFDIAASNNVNVADRPELTVTGKGNYKGTATGTFTIAPANVSSVTVKNTEGYIYSGQPVVPTLEVKSGVLTLNATDYDVNYNTDHTKAGTVTFTVTGKGNFAGTSSVTSFTISAKPIEVTINKQTVTYNGEVPNVSSVKDVAWSARTGDICGQDDLLITLTAQALTATAGKYDISAQCGNSNYNVTFKYGADTVTDREPAREAFEIEKATITVTVQAARSTYGDPQAELVVVPTGIFETDVDKINIKEYLTLTCEVTATSAAKDYDIVCETNGRELDNYDIAIVNEVKYTVDKKNITVHIGNQTDEYGYEKSHATDMSKSYAWNKNAWTVDEGTPLANDEDKSVLGVSLTRPALGNAGKYAITATYSGGNYNVTFQGDWSEEDGNKGKAGVYTISKRRVEENGETVMFYLMVNGEEYQGTELFPYFGEDFELTAVVYVWNGEDYDEPDCTIDPERLTEVKIYIVTVTIDDVNYEGSRTFTVEVVSDDGFSQNLKEVLAELERIAGDVRVDSLASTEENFEMLKKVKEQLAKLTDADKELGAEQLAKYEDLVNAWSDAANVSDEVIRTAKDMADLPIKWLFALAEASIMLAALYIVGKGGLM